VRSELCRLGSQAGIVHPFAGTRSPGANRGGSGTGPDTLRVAPCRALRFSSMMANRTVFVQSALLPRLLAAIGAGSLLAAPGCGGKTQSNGSLSDGVDGVAQTSEEQESTSQSVTTTKPNSSNTVAPPSIPTTGGPTSNTVINTVTDVPSTVPTASESTDETSNWTTAVPTLSTGETSEDTTWVLTSGEPTGEATVVPSVDGGSAQVTCEFGTPQQFCLNVEQMESQARSGVGEIPLDPPRSDDDIAAGWDANGCMKYEWIATGCCNPAELPGEPQGDGSCCYVACEGACCGRPFFVNGAAIVAEVVPASSWLLGRPMPESRTVSLELDTQARRLLGEAWLADAQMEHASIASFAQFSLDLLRLGAPPALIRDSHLAGLDEIEHARIAFSIAENLSGVAMGPAALPLGNLDVHSVSDAIAAAIVEGCIGETLASAVLAEQAERCTDPEIARHLKQIAEDELRHAELAWRFVAWSIERYGATARATVSATFAAAFSKLPVAPHASGLTDEQLHAAGRISPADWSRVVESVVRGVLEPAASTLLGAASMAAASERNTPESSIATATCAVS
jgi:hypothetical protein